MKCCASAVGSVSWYSLPTWLWLVLQVHGRVLGATFIVALGVQSAMAPVFLSPFFRLRCLALFCLEMKVYFAESCHSSCSAVPFSVKHEHPPLCTKA